MKKFNLLLGSHKYAFYIVFFFCAALIITAFFLPPMAIIDSSVLKGVGFLGLFYPMYLAGEALERGYDVKMKHHNTEVTLSDGIQDEAECESTEENE